MVAVPSIGRAAQPNPQHATHEADATRRLYEQYARQIYAYCLHQLRSKEEAEDATQSTFLNAFRGLQRGIDPEFESAWLYKIAQNVCLTRQRSTTRRRRVESPGDLDAMQDVLPAREVDSHELIGLPEALNLMPEQQRRALLLREWQGLSYKEIAAELDLSQAAVETLLFRARRSLANGLSEEEKSSLATRIQSGADAGSVLPLLKSLLVTGGAKVAATVATVAATSAVAVSPAARHVVSHAVDLNVPPARAAVHPSAAAPVPAVRSVARPHVFVAPSETAAPAAPAVPRHHVRAAKVVAAKARLAAALMPAGHVPSDVPAPVPVSQPVPVPAAPAPAVVAPAPAPAPAAAPTPPAPKAKNDGGTRAGDHGNGKDNGKGNDVPPTVAGPIETVPVATPPSYVPGNGHAFGRDNGNGSANSTKVHGRNDGGTVVPDSTAPVAPAPLPVVADPATASLPAPAAVPPAPTATTDSTTPAPAPTPDVAPGNGKNNVDHGNKP